MTTLRSNNSFCRGRQGSNRNSVNSKTREQVTSKSQMSPFLKRDNDYSQLLRSSSKKLKVIKDDAAHEEIHDLEFLKNKLDKLPPKRIYYKSLDNQKQDRINKQINKFLNLSDINDNNAPLLNKLKLIRNCSLPFITINAVDLSVLKIVQNNIDNPPSNGRNNLLNRNLSNSFEYLSLNFNKKKSSVNHNVNEAKESIPQPEESKHDDSEDSELKQFLEDLKEHNKELLSCAENKISKPQEIENKQTDLNNDSLLELENFLIESGLTPIKETKIININGYPVGEIKKIDVETIPSTEANFTEKINETYTTTMSKKRVSFSEKKTIIKYDKKGDVKEYYLFGEDDVLIKKIINTFKKFSQKDKQEKYKSILVKKNNVNHSPSIQESKNFPEKKNVNFNNNNLKLKNVKSRFLDINYNIKYKRNLNNTPKNQISVSKNHAFLHIPKTNKFINRNINMINQIAEKKRNKENSLNLSKRSSKQEKNFKRNKSALCRKFIGNPNRFYTNIPPIVQLDSLKLDSTFVHNYKSVTESILLNNSVHSTNRNELLYSFKTDDNTIMTDGLTMDHGENCSLLNMINNSMDDYQLKSRSVHQKSDNRKSVTVIDNFFSN